MLKLQGARYSSGQCYKGMEMVIEEHSVSSIFEDNSDESIFSIYLLNHKSDLSSKIIKLDFDESFIKNLTNYSLQLEWLKKKK